MAATTDSTPPGMAVDTSSRTHRRRRRVRRRLLHLLRLLLGDERLLEAPVEVAEELVGGRARRRRALPRLADEVPEGVDAAVRTLGAVAVADEAANLRVAVGGDAGPGDLVGGELVHGAAEAVDVGGRGGHRVFLPELRGVPVGGAEGAGGDERAVLAARVRLRLDLLHPEVAALDEVRHPPVRRGVKNQEIRGLDVLVDEALGVDVGDGAGAVRGHGPAGGPAELGEGHLREELVEAAWGLGGAEGRSGAQQTGAEDGAGEDRKEGGRAAAPRGGAGRSKGRLRGS